MTAPPRIAVLAALGRNPSSGAARPNRDDVVALEMARRLDGEITLLHAGDRAPEAVADYFAYGAGNVTVLPVGEGHDIAAALAEQAAGFDLVLTGTRAEGGEGSGLVPYLVAERLDLPIVGQALDVAIADGFAAVTQFMPKGRRRRVRVRLPAVIAVHPMAPVVPRYAYARRAAGRIVTAAPAPPTEAAGVAWQVEPAARASVKFRAAETRDGHARMLSAIASEARGGIVIKTGTPADKAQAILAYLREHRLIDW